MNRRGVWVVMVMSALMVLVCVPKAWGQRPPETHPVSTTQDVVRSWDRSVMPGDIEIWPARTLLAYQNLSPYIYGTSHLVCRSSTDSSTGKCPTEGSREAINGAGEIWVQDLERRTGLTTDVRVMATLMRPMSGTDCSSDYWASARRPVWHAEVQRCGTDYSAGLGVDLRIQAADLERLVAGSWHAELSLLFVDVIGGSEMASHTFSLDFTITDHNAVSIYLPQFESTTPLVNLDARYDPIQQTVGGRTVVEMCLYDGLGSQASYLAVTARDISPRSAGNSGFSLWHDSSGSDASQRLDYTITLDHNGARVPLNNGVEEQLTGIDSSQLRLVMLPGMRQPVFCVDTPMTLDMPRVPSTSKRSGIYWGDLQLELRVPAGTP